MKNLGIKVLHVSHELLDIKTERVAHTNVKYGCKVFFAGPYKDAPWGFNTALFHRLYEVKFDRATIVGVPHRVAKIKEKIRGIVKKCKPDLIHAHNVFAARLVMDIGLPFIYDAHEFWSERARISNNPRHYYRRLTWPSWEREVLRNAHAVITVSDTIAEYFRKFNDNVFVVPNFPRLVEVEHLKLKKDPQEFSSVTLGKFSSKGPPTRNVKGFLNLFRKYDLGKLVVIGDVKLKTSPPIYSKGYLHHDQFLEELTHHYLGIIPFRSWI